MRKTFSTSLCKDFCPICEKTVSEALPKDFYNNREKTFSKKRHKDFYINYEKMKDIKILAAQLLNAVGFEYEKLEYKRYRESQQKSHGLDLFMKPKSIQIEIKQLEENNCMTSLQKIMYHAAEIKNLLK